MSSLNRLQLQGLLTEKRLTLKRLVTRADALVANLHMQCNPHLPVYELYIDQIVSQVRDLEKAILEIRQLRQDIRALEADLGIESNG